jgi:TRAP-type C4-dicarboxylate transport system permease small subunit
MPEAEKKGIGYWVSTVMNKLSSACGVTLLVLMCGMILLLGINIFLRYVFDSPIAWSNTISRYIYIIIALVGSAIAYTQQGHARIDVLYDRVGPKTKKVFDFCHYVIMMIMCAIFMVVGTQHAIKMWPVHPPIIPWLPIGSIYLAIPIFSFLIFLYLLKKMISLFSARSCE